MKRFSILILALLMGIAFTACNEGGDNGNSEEQSEVNTDNPPVFEFGDGSEEAMTHDFGSMKEGEVVEHTFNFKNVGKSDLIIQKVKPSCGCTVPEYTQDAVKPGGTGKIQIKFDSDGKTGKQNKSVTVHANTNPRVTKLRFTADVAES